ncbi:MAG: tripartite tricarboxylate transporter substrate binding protein, partial [Betaproteobacteria bacterium]|nr:tripartite tricarboxylate transporter substrate binding protein [Betaproteobacteria bacterium]
MMLRTALVAALALLTIAPGAGASEYPARPIRIIVQFTPGTSTDVLARLIAAKMSDRWNQQVIVD